MYCINTDDINDFDTVVAMGILDDIINLDEANEDASTPIDYQTLPMVAWNEAGHCYTAEYLGKGVYTCDGNPVPRDAVEESILRICAYSEPALWDM